MATIVFQPISKTLVSTDTGNPVGFSVTNNTAGDMSIYWVDRDGVRQLYSTIKPGGTYTQGTTSTSHVWEIKSADGKIAGDFLPTTAGNLAFGLDNRMTFSDFSEKFSTAPDGMWSTAQGYGLIDVAKSLGVADTVDLPMNGKNNNLALNAINAPSAWAAGITGKGVKVAVIDVGIAANSEINKSIVGGYDFYQNDTDPTPDAGNFKDHALGVASIIAGSHTPQSGPDTRGVAPDAQLLNVRVGSSVNGSSNSAIVNGVNWAVENGAKVICMPLQNQSDSVDPALVTAIHNAYLKGVVVVVIGGNFGNYGATGPALAALQLKGELIDVGNYNVMTGGQFDSSNMPGATAFPWVMASSSGYVPNSDGGYTYWGDGGTSFAGPYVAGLAALLWEQNPNATAGEIIKKIIAGATLPGENQVTTPVKDLVAPTVLSFTPANDVTNVGVDRDIVINFSEAIVKGVGKITLTDGAGKVAATYDIATSPAVKVSGSLLVLTNPGTLKADATYTLSMAAGTIKDIAGNNYAGSNSYHFSTTTTVAPVTTKVTVGTSADESFTTTSANDYIHGNGGLDTVIYHGALSNYTVAATAGGFTVNDKTGVDGLDTLVQVSRLHFADKDLALDVYGNGGDTYRLYQAAFNRAPDKAGLGYWMDAVDQGMSLATVADNFTQSAEFASLYKGATNADLVKAVYQNVLHRAPDAAGLSFWVTALSNGAKPAELITAFSASAENVDASIKIIGQGFEYIPFHA